MTVLITGVAGRVGSTLAGELVRAGYEVRGMLRPGGRRLEPAVSRDIQLVEAGLTDAGALAEAMEGVDIVVHLAAQIGIGNTAVDDYLDVNVLGTARLLEAAVATDGAVRRFIHASTDNTYGPAAPRTTPIRETEPQLPGDYYGTSKLLAEQLVLNYNKLHGLPYSILRYGSVVAPHETLGLFRLDWIRAFLAAHVQAGRRSNLWELFDSQPDPVAILDGMAGGRTDNPAVVLTGTDGRPWSVHLTDVRDVASATAAAVERPEALGECFNIGGPGTTTFAAAAAVIAARFDVEILSVEMPMKLAFELSVEKARQRIGYRPRWDFPGMIDTALNEKSSGYVSAGG